MQVSLGAANPIVHLNYFQHIIQIFQILAQGHTPDYCSSYTPSPSSRWDSCVQEAISALLVPLGQIADVKSADDEDIV